METAQFAILAILSAISIALCAYLLLKIRNITYLLEQPVVKKMSPQLKLKPVKVDELDDESRRNASRNPVAPSNGAPQNRSPRPAFEGGERPPRSEHTRERGPRTDRPEGERPPREGGFDRGGERGDRSPRNDRGDRGGFRDRGGRNERHDRQGGGRDAMGGGRDAMGAGREGGDRTRAPRTESFGQDRDAAPVEGSPAPAPRPAPIVTEHAAPTSALAPRRPLPSMVDHESIAREIPAPVEAMSASAAEDALFVRDDSDIQHGRRHQPKKKPRFNVGEEEVKAATTEETKA